MRNIKWMIISLFIITAFINSGCSNRKVKFDCSNITKIRIENRAAHRYGGISEVLITDSSKIADFCERISLLKNESRGITRPFKGSVQIEFIYVDNRNVETIMSEYSTCIIFKANDDYFITNINGHFTDDVFLNNIKLLLQFKK